MCTVSMVYDEYGKTPINPWVPTVPSIDLPAIPWTVTTGGHVPEQLIPRTAVTPLEIFEELVAVAARLDRALGLPDCEDPAKADWLDKVRAAVRKHEADEVERRLAKKP